MNLNKSIELNLIKARIENELSNITTDNAMTRKIKQNYSKCLEIIEHLKNDNYKALEKYQLKITNHSGKMEYINSLNTEKTFSCTCNKMQKLKSTICNSCYVDKTKNQYKQVTSATIYNSLLLRFVDLQDNQIFRTYNTNFFRFESFSDLQNMQHLENLMKIANANPFTTFTLWTKNIQLVKNYFKNNSIPENFILIISSPIINNKLNDNIFKSFYEIGFKENNFKVFTVYDDETVKINCKKKCIECLKCYTKNDIKHISEFIK